MNTDERKMKKNRHMHSFVPTAKAYRVLGKAKTVGIDKSAICNTAIELYGEQIIRDELAKRANLARFILPEAPPESRPPRTAGGWGKPPAGLLPPK